MVVLQLIVKHKQLFQPQNCKKKKKKKKKKNSQFRVIRSPGFFFSKFYQHVVRTVSRNVWRDF